MRGYFEGLRRSYQALPGAWTREGDWLAARWTLRHRRGHEYELETAVQLEGATPPEPPPEPPSAEAALAALLLPAMRRGRPLRLPGPLDATLEGNLPRLQGMHTSLFPEYGLQPVAVRTPSTRSEGEQRPADRRVGVFASMGVDSFFSLLAHREEIDDLVLVRGFDIGLESQKDELWEEVASSARTLAEKLGKRLVAVRTNMRPFLHGRHIPWGPGHGAVLAHVALTLQPWLRTLYLPASFDINNISPWGSHPDMDPLWSTSDTRIVHDGAQFNRLQKVQQIAKSSVALEHLRVCLANPNGAYNCGRCRKCLPTMLALETVGALERCETFPDEVTALDLGGVLVWGVGGRLFMAELRDWWAAHDPKHELLPLTEKILAREDIHPD